MPYLFSYKARLFFSGYKKKVDFGVIFGIATEFSDIFSKLFHVLLFIFPLPFIITTVITKLDGTFLFLPSEGNHGNNVNQEKGSHNQ